MVKQIVKDPFFCNRSQSLQLMLTSRSSQILTRGKDILTLFR